MKGTTAGTWIAALVFVTAALAGCLAGLPDDAGAAGDGAATGADGPRFGPESGLPLDGAAEQPRTLDAPPQWAVGEWWRIRVDYPPYDHSAEITRVVAGVEGPAAPDGEPDWQAGAYLVGLAKDSWDDGSLVLHFPGVGHVDPATLGFEAHDLLIEPLSFPLEEGRTWTTQWYSGDPLEAEVVEVADDGTARIEMEGAQTIELTYDAGMGAVSELWVEGYGGYEVVDHGFGFEGRVRVPYGHDLLFCHGRVAVAVVIEPCALDLMDPAVGGPDIEVEVPEGYDGASFGLLMADLDTTAPLGLGVYAVEVTAPDGATYAAQKLPHEGSTKLVPHGAEVGTGTWHVRAEAAGAGLALFEGVAYRIFDVELPGGVVQG